MTMPTPDDPANAPVWENYVVAQAVQASLRLIPRGTLAFGVEVDRENVRLQFQLAEVSDEDAADITDITEDLTSLLGGQVRVSSVHAVREQPELSPDDHVRWIFVARA